jgi:branched-chain amino acid aminotransferase
LLQAATQFQGEPKVNSQRTKTNGHAKKEKATAVATPALAALGLQTPEWAYFKGDVRPWAEATLHVSTEAVNRGLNVFEGLKGYWSADEKKFGIVQLRRHYERLKHSAQLLYIPVPVSYEEFQNASVKLLRKLYGPDRDMWVRASLYVVEGHWGEGTVADLVLTAYHQKKTPPTPIKIGVSTWQRSSDNTVPPRIKTSTNYQVARLARIEGRARGCSEMILLNQSGRVAEATGACVLVVRDGCVITPPATEGRLESITLEIVEKICKSLSIPFVERPIDRTELRIADEIRLVGTLAEMTPVSWMDDYELPAKSPLTDAIAETFWKAVRGIKAHPAIEMTLV